MSRTTQGEYRCDWCKANLTLKETTKDHITLEIGSRSGVASDRGPLPGWRIISGIPAGQYHFCSMGGCIEMWLAILRDPPGDQNG